MNNKKYKPGKLVTTATLQELFLNTPSAKLYIKRINGVRSVRATVSMPWISVVKMLIAGDIFEAIHNSPQDGQLTGITSDVGHRRGGDKGGTEGPQEPR